MPELEEIPYSNRELNEKFANLSSLIRDKHDDVMIKVVEVLTQAKMTNGSVAALKLWQARIIGALTVIGFVLASIIVPLLGSYISAGGKL